ncbi:hypothetical protein GC177_10585 [bacterium]|nr:hypothetical protein [bacterium]
MTKTPWALTLSLLLTACTQTFSHSSEAMDQHELDKFTERFNQHMAPCFAMPSGLTDMRNVPNMIVHLKVTMLPNGGVHDVKITDTERYKSDPAFRATANSFERAVRLCSPYDKILPMDRYLDWQIIEMDFDPSPILH